MLKPGDKVMRYLSDERIPMEMLVDKVEDGIVYCKGGWTFDAQFGYEIDEYLGWGPLPDGTIYTGSVIELKPTS